MSSAKQTANCMLFWVIDKKDGYRQRNVRQFLQSAQGTIWLPQESHAGMSLPSPVLPDGGIWLRQESLRHILASPG